MKEKLLAMLTSLIKNDTEEAEKYFHECTVYKSASIVEGKDSDDDEEDDDEEDDDEEDEDDDEKAEKKEKKAIKDLVKAQKKEDKGEKKKEVDEMAASHEKGVKNRDHGELYQKIIHKDDSEGYGYEKVKKTANKGLDSKDKSSGANEKKGDAYKAVPHKDDSEGYGYDTVKKKSRSGLHKAKEGVKSPDGDGKKENRRTDKAK